MNPSSNVLCLGGAGKICSEAVRDLSAHAKPGAVSRIVVADIDGSAAEDLASGLRDERVEALALDLRDEDAAVESMRGFDIVMDGTPIHLNDLSTRCIARAGCHGVNLNGFGEEFKYDPLFKEHGRIHVPGFGMTPGTTNLMAKEACDPMEKVFFVRVSHGAFRPFAFSPGIAETTAYEYAPDLPGRVVWEGGRLVQVPPFARPLDVELPAPFGTRTQYIIPHSETVTLADYLSEKDPDLIEVRGTWPSANMRLLRVLHEWGFLRNDRVVVGGTDVGIMDCVAAYLRASPEGTTTDLCGYALHVQAEGMEGGRRVRRTLWNTHPASDGSEAAWAGLRAYTRSVGIPLGVAVQLIAQGRFEGIGVVIPERAFRPEDLFSELALREIHIHRQEEWTDP